MTALRRLTDRIPGTVLVPGTHGWRGLGTTGEWWQFGSPFATMLDRQGVDVLPPFVWTTDLAGTWWSGRKEWECAALNLRTHVERHCRRSNQRRLVAHSHGGNVALLCAAMGCDLDVVICVGMPVRADLMSVYHAARHHVRHWLHIFHPGWADKWQWLGAVMDGRVGIVRELPPMAPAGEGRTLVQHRLAGLGHGDVLRTRVELWQSEGWIDYLRAPAREEAVCDVR